MNEQELQKAFVAFLIQDAEAQGLTIQSEEDMKNYIQQLGEEGYAAKQQEFMQKMQGTPSKKLGGHLAYLNKLKGNCPDGEEMIYMKEGGRVCPKCVKKAKGGDKAKKIDPKKDAISDFKEKRKAVNPNDTVHVGGKPKSLTNADGSRVDKRFPAYTNEDYKKDKNTKDGQKRRMKADLVSSEKCGGKTKKNVKKHFIGGPLAQERSKLAQYANVETAPEKLKNSSQLAMEQEARNYINTGSFNGKKPNEGSMIQRKGLLSRAANISGRNQNYFRNMYRYVNDNMGPKVTQQDTPSFASLVPQESLDKTKYNMTINAPGFLKRKQLEYGHANVKAGNDGYYYHPAQAVSYAIGTN